MRAFLRVATVLVIDHTSSENVCGSSYSFKPKMFKVSARVSKSI